MELNENQVKAINHTDGPLLIIAGAGTGKTTVLTERIKNLLNKEKLSSNNIAALTFTEKAAGEMAERLGDVMPYGYEEPWISTFHGFCDRILRAEGIEIGLSPDYKIMTASGQYILLKQHIFDLGLQYYVPLNNPSKFILALIKFFSRLQDEQVSNKEIENYQKRKEGKILNQVQDDMENKDGSPRSTAARRLEDNSNVNEEIKQKYKELFTAWEKYKALKLKENLLDFGDLISWTLELFTKRPSVLAKYKQQFVHVLVDEFQDTNFSQLQLIKLLKPPEENPNLTVVGDDDQAIYAFRGSSIHNILDFKTHYPKATEIVLTNNYRSGQHLLNASYNSIQKNNPDRLESVLKIDKRLVAMRGKTLPKPEIIEVDSLETETEFVVEKILELVAGQYSYKDIAILARANSHLDPFVAALRRYGLAYQLVGNRGLFDQEEVKNLLFFLKAVVDPYDQTNLFQFLHIDVFAISPAELLRLLGIVKQTRTTLWEMVQQEAIKNEKLKKIVDLLTVAQEQDSKRPITEIVHDFIHESKYLDQYLKEESIEHELNLKNINLFFNHLKRFDTENHNSSIATYVEYFDLLLEAGENPAQAQIEDIDTVSLLTIHAAKGLEWPIVFLVNMVSDRFPSRNRSDVIEIPEPFIKQRLPKGDFHLQEERRLFYVAVTRARDYLFAVYGADYGNTRPKKPSGFLSELGVETIHWQPKGRQLSWLTQQVGSVEAKPKKIIEGQLQLTYVSYSQLDTYETCPLRYKYQYVLQVPTRPDQNITFGSTIHTTLQKFHRFELKGQQPSLETLLTIYEHDFQHLGYSSETHRQKRYERGKVALTAYYKNYKQQFSGKPTQLEVSFRLGIDNLPLVGRIDRIDQLPNNGLELIDYKTGSVREQKEVDKDAQLTVYSMASQALYGKIPDILSLYFIDDGVKVSTTRDQKQIEKKKEEMIATIHTIKQGKFEAKAGYPMPCGYCPYNQICPFAKRS